eukprot:TRINITY_DN7394_c0_g1_i1.p1 TRINITY_DN7394_c0_g1~~TRINITY_DN7394_c0_g1_i1.p1  ORF type:complete len:687 (-),score=121.25 TRINITY_DN7394_c0_g1_i1:125-2185(-)
MNTLNNADKKSLNAICTKDLAWEAKLREDAWQCFSVEAQGKMNSAFRRWQQTAEQPEELIQSGHFKYRIIFASDGKHRQKNVQTQRERDIRQTQKKFVDPDHESEQLFAERQKANTAAKHMLQAQQSMRLQKAQMTEQHMKETEAMKHELAFVKFMHNLELAIEAKKAKDELQCAQAALEMERANAANLQAELDQAILNQNLQKAQITEQHTKEVEAMKRDASAELARVKWFHKMELAIEAKRAKDERQCAEAALEMERANAAKLQAELDQVILDLCLQKAQMTEQHTKEVEAMKRNASAELVRVNFHHKMELAREAKKARDERHCAEAAIELERANAAKLQAELDQAILDQRLLKAQMTDQHKKEMEAMKRGASAQLEFVKFNHEMRLATEAQKLKDERECAEAALATEKAKAAKLQAELDQVILDQGMKSAFQLPDRTLLPETTALIKIENHDPIHKFVASLMKKSMANHRRDISSTEWCDKPIIQVESIEMIQNSILLEQYALARKTLAIRLEDSPCMAPSDIESMIAGKLVREKFTCAIPLDPSSKYNEALLFHGTQEEVVQDIAREGFDPQRGGESFGKMFGTGTYFAHNASKCMLYTKNHGVIIVARVLLGNPHCQKERCPQRSRPPDNFTSLIAMTRAEGGSVDHREYIVFDKQKALPLYVVRIKHLEECKCHLCASTT